MRGSAATECNSRRYFAAAREGLDRFDVHCDARQSAGPDARHATPQPAARGSPGPQPVRAEVFPSFSALAAGLPHAADADARLLRRRQSDFQVQLREIGAWSPRRERHSTAGHAQARANPRVLKVDYFYPTTLGVHGPSVRLGTNHQASLGLTSVLGGLSSPLLGRRPTT